MFDTQVLLVQHPENQSHAADHADNSPASTLRKKKRYHHRQDDTDQCAHVAHSQTASNHDCQNRKQVSEVLQVIEERVPTAELPASPWSRPTFLAQVVDHLNGIEVARQREVQHADNETGDREREVSIDRELLRNGADQNSRRPPDPSPQPTATCRRAITGSLHDCPVHWTQPKPSECLAKIKTSASL